MDPKELFVNGGETGQLMHIYQWENNIVGTPDTWPPHLRTAVRIMLTSVQPMFIWWGEQFIHLYNDAFIPFAGKGHPSVLGRPASEIWADEWMRLAPVATAAVAENAGSFIKSSFFIMKKEEDDEDISYAFSYSPILGPDNVVDGLLGVYNNYLNPIMGHSVDREVPVVENPDDVDLDTRLGK